MPKIEKEKEDSGHGFETKSGMGDTRIYIYIYSKHIQNSAVLVLFFFPLCSSTAPKQGGDEPVQFSDKGRG